MKPDWFKLADSDKPDPINVQYRPIGILSFILGVVVTAVFFLYPAENSVKPTPVAEVVETTILPEFTEDIAPVWEEEEDEESDDE
jgi:hypothetical protein